MEAHEILAADPPPSSQFLAPPIWASLIFVVLVVGAIAYCLRLLPAIAASRAAKRRVLAEQALVARALAVARDCCIDDPRLYGARAAAQLIAAQDDIETAWDSHVVALRRIDSQVAGWGVFLREHYEDRAHAYDARLRHVRQIAAAIAAGAHQRADLNRHRTEAPRVLVQLRAERAAFAERIQSAYAGLLQADRCLAPLDNLLQQANAADHAGDVGSLVELLARARQSLDELAARLSRLGTALVRTRDPEVAPAARAVGEAVTALIDTLPDAASFERAHHVFEELVRRLHVEAEELRARRVTLLASRDRVVEQLEALEQAHAQAIADVQSVTLMLAEACVSPLQAWAEEARRSLGEARLSLCSPPSSEDEAAERIARAEALIQGARQQTQRTADECAHLRQVRQTAREAYQRAERALTGLWNVLRRHERELGTELVDRIVALTGEFAAVDEAARQERPDWPRLSEPLVRYDQAIEAVLEEARRTVDEARSLRTSVGRARTAAETALEQMLRFASIYARVLGESEVPPEPLSAQFATLGEAYERGLAAPQPSMVRYLEHAVRHFSELGALCEQRYAELQAAYIRLQGAPPLDDLVRSLDATGTAEQPGYGRRRRGERYVAAVAQQTAAVGGAASAPEVAAEHKEATSSPARVQESPRARAEAEFQERKRKKQAEYQQQRTQQEAARTKERQQRWAEQDREAEAERLRQAQLAHDEQIRRQLALEDQQRRQWEIDEQTRRQRELEDQQRRQRELADRQYVT